MEVPLKLDYPPGTVDNTATPGAAKSTGGFPKLEKDANTSSLSIADTV